MQVTSLFSCALVWKKTWRVSIGGKCRCGSYSYIYKYISLYLQYFLSCESGGKKFGGVYYNCYTLWPLRRTHTHTHSTNAVLIHLHVPVSDFSPPVSRGNNEHIMAWHCTMNNTAQENPFRKVDTKERFILF